MYVYIHILLNCDMHSTYTYYIIMTYAAKLLVPAVVH